MPEIKLKHVVSCSTEDSTHKAENLLSSDTYRKWKAARAGEKQTSVILQFEKEEQVHSIDIGNEGSAFIEVLVGNSSAVRDQDYEVILVTSSFMSPTESRNGTNLNRVRFFGPNQLQKSTAQEKWDRVKIVCTQPYSKNIAYGLAFVKFHSTPDKNDSPPTSSPKLTKLGQFKIKDDSPTSGPSLQPGSLFFSRENASKSSTPLKGKCPVVLLVKRKTVAQGLLQSLLSNGKQTEQDKTLTFLSLKERQSAAGPPPSKKPSPGGSPPEKKKKESSSNTEPKPKSKPRTVQQVPFNCTLQGVVIVLSGFQNPLRGELREKALDMGAKYQTDWTPNSTHLICAFANTPKYSQVKSAGGIIVRKEWVLDCHKRKQKISYKRYLMDGAESSSESEMDVDEQTEEEEEEREQRKEVNKDHKGSSDQSTLRTAAGEVAVKEEDDPYGGSTDENTDAEAEMDHPIPDLPDFLSGKYFFLYGNFPNNERRLLLRYIVAFNGVIEDYMTEKVQFVVTSDGWQDSFEDALMENGNLNFVKPTWIYAINERQKMLPHQPYAVVP
uniref:DNA repair protein XRCC1 n=1 Tax=Gouania willdenowi TaxID=441366 RepID=A0A8C5GZ60_GOUWI